MASCFQFVLYFTLSIFGYKYFLQRSYYVYSGGPCDVCGIVSHGDMSVTGVRYANIGRQGSARGGNMLIADMSLVQQEEGLEWVERYIKCRVISTNLPLLQININVFLRHVEKIVESGAKIGLETSYKQFMLIVSRFH